MDLPTIHTNFWDAIFAVPVVMVVTQILKLWWKPPKILVPTIAVLIGLAISIFISHKGELFEGLLMGFFYGYAGIGSYASLKTTLIHYRRKYFT